MARTNYTSLGLNTIGKNDADIEAQVFRYNPITEAQRDAIVSPVNGMKIYNSDTNTIQGYISGAWPVPSGETVVIAHEDAWKQTRTQVTIFATGSSSGTVISQLDTVITPSKAGNKVVVDFVVFGEANDAGANGFVISRNGVLMDDTTDGSNNQYAANCVSVFETNVTSTPQVHFVRLIDENTLSIESTYRVLYRRTKNSSATFFFNRSVNSPADSTETGVSTSKVIEYVT